MSKKPLHPDSVILQKIGGTGAIARRLGLGLTQVSNWRVRGIPWPYRFDIADIVEADGGELPPNWLRNREQ